MKKAPPISAPAAPGVYRQVFKEGEAALLTVTARWPRLEESAPGPRRVNRYYDALFAHWRRRWEGPLLERAKAAAGPETPPWAASLDFTVARSDPEVLSLWWEAAEETGGRKRRVRRGDVWALPAGVPLSLWELLPRRRWQRGAVMECIRAQIGQRLRTGESIYYEDWPRLVSRHFSPERFFLAPDGPAVFYPPETIAPSLEGFPTFSLAELCTDTAPEAEEKSGL